MEPLAPIILFTYNRLEETKKTVESLLQNYLAEKSELFIFSDGCKLKSGSKKIEAVRAYLKSIKGFKKITIKENEENKGLAKSIIDGVTEIFENYDKVIVLEDDLVSTPNFLNFMNQSLNFYENAPRVMSISGYTLDLPSLKTYNKDFYAGYRACSLGWGTWRNKWNIDWSVSDYPSFKKNYIKQFEFFKIGSDMPKMLKRQMEGKIDSWAIRWCYHQFKNELITIFAAKSKIAHIGDGEDATNASGTDKFDTPLDQGMKLIFEFENDPKLNKQITNEFKAKFSVSTRIIAKIKRAFKK